MIGGHAHLDEIEAIEQAVERAKAVGICGLNAVGMDKITNEATLALAKRFDSFLELTSMAMAKSVWTRTDTVISRRGDIYECRGIR